MNSPGRRKLDARHKVVVISGSVAAMSGVAALLSPRHSLVLALYGVFLAGALTYVVKQMIKVKQMERRRKSATRGGQA